MEVRSVRLSSESGVDTLGYEREETVTSTVKNAQRFTVAGTAVLIIGLP